MGVQMSRFPEAIPKSELNSFDKFNKFIISVLSPSF